MPVELLEDANLQDFTAPKPRGEPAEEYLAKSKRENVLAKDLTDNLQAQNAELEARAFKDGLTQLFNREGFMNEVLKQPDENLRKGAVLFLDVDDFKKFNSDYGHGVGDMALITAANNLRAVFRNRRDHRDPDIIARWGGEEFVVYLPNANSSDVLKSLRGSEGGKDDRTARIKAPFVINSEKESVPVSKELTFSGGIANFDAEAGETLEQVIDRASLLMKNAKEGGKNKIISNLDIKKQ